MLAINAWGMIETASLMAALSAHFMAQPMLAYRGR